MSKVVSFIICLTVFVNSSISQSTVIDSLEISTTDITLAHKFSEELKCQSFHSKLFYDNPDMYSVIIGNVLDKRFQTIEMNGEIGSILYFEFDKAAEDSKTFVEATLWGGNGPTKDNPEEVLVVGNMMIIISFPLTGDSRKLLIELIEAKITAITNN